MTRLVALGIVMLICGSASAGDSTGNGRMSLTLNLDDSTYLLGQPILVAACVRNGTQTKFDDLVPLDPEAQFLQLRLVNLETGKALLKYGTRRTVLFPQDGMTIAPGEAQCELFDLLKHFGGWPSREQVVLKSLAMYSLPPGNYELSAALAARTGHNEALKPVTLASNQVRFQVMVGGSNPKEEADLASLASGQEWRTNSLSPANVHRARESLRLSVASPYFVLFYRAARSSMSRSDLDSLDLLLQRANAPSLRRAVLVWDEFDRVSMSDSERLSRLDSVARRSRDAAIQDVVRSLKMRVQQRKYYRP